jgi:Flp pilus assembly protein TadD
MSQDIRELHEQVKKDLSSLLEGQGTLREALGFDADQIASIAVLCRELVEQGKLDDAQTILEGIVLLDPQNGYLHTCLGSVYVQKGLKDAARAEYAYALKLDANDIAANTYYAELLIEQGDLERAASYLQKAVELDPEANDPFANRARTLAMMVAAVAREVETKGPAALEEIRQRMAFIQQEEGNA